MKLLFEDDNGKQHNINISSIKADKIKKGDVICATYEVGNASNKDASAVLSQLNDIIKNIFPENEVLTIATRGKVEDVELKIINKE